MHAEEYTSPWAANDILTWLISILIYMCTHYNYADDYMFFIHYMLTITCSLYTIC
jgi:hypothetical protein